MTRHDHSRDDTTLLMSLEERSKASSKQSMFAMRLSLWIGFLMLIMKIYAYLITGSAAILSDAAEPTGNAVAAMNLLRLAQITDNEEWKTMAEHTFRCFGSHLQQVPEVAPQMLVGLLWNLSTPKEVIVAGDKTSSDTKAIVKEINSHFIPNKILLLADNGEAQQKLQRFLPFMEGVKTINGNAAAYICEHYACQLPTSDRTVIKDLLTKKPAQPK